MFETMRRKHARAWGEGERMKRRREGEREEERETYYAVIFKGVIIEGLEELKVLENTYVIFTSDNGYHLGEHKLPFGKGEPYETDIRLPMYIRGPNVYQNATLPHPTTHLDITATVVEITGAQSFAPANLDGKNFLGELTAISPFSSTFHPNFGTRADAWRQFSFSEFFADNNTWQNIRVRNSTHAFTYHSWCTGDVEVFDLLHDPHQTTNLAGTNNVCCFTPAAHFPAGIFSSCHRKLANRYNASLFLKALAIAVETEFTSVLSALGGCSGTACSHPASHSFVHPLKCYPVITGKGAVESSWNLLSDGASSPVTAVRGWVVDFKLIGGHNHARGWPPVTVKLLVDGWFLEYFCECH